MINKYRRTVNKEFEKSSFWPTFTDLLSTVLMVVILTLFSTQSISGSVKQDLAQNINNSVEETLKNDNIPVKVDKRSGQVTFGESTMFDVDSDELKPEAKEMLKKFIPKYVETVYKDYGSNISKIVVEGHTDDIGSYLYNLDLSQRRAYSVTKYMVSDEIGDYKYKTKFTKHIIAVGRSKADLIKNKDGSVNRDSSRRVELKYEIDID
ncbi:OmpA family protein [Metaclostridioides mangenotii]|uniref:Outer membrane protein OmpA-like peptidoglycan-associated protein n=1 Tax=Metaclostridioides mangenotii TaxID=1540 RepID=A0ABS4E824_9FIRM|nr:OmpA family protein [Clostridioides mangenotii]MBP1854097.1 outer membrane protein OmpA-like peptidoglycan-associated protein [Clostridioides mangenotii]